MRSTTPEGLDTTLARRGAYDRRLVLYHVLAVHHIRVITVASPGCCARARAGKEEILNRRIGRHELAAIEVCRAYVDAQLEYYLRNPQNAPLLHSAQKFLSSKGQRDGLYWATMDDEAPSPLGPLIARAQGKGYVKAKDARGKPVSYYGYYYRILKAQGPDAPGGAPRLRGARQDARGLRAGGLSGKLG